MHDLNLTTQPRKVSDKKSYPGIGGETSITCQAEAIPPDQLARIVRAEVEALICLESHAEALADEREARDDLSKKFSKVMS
ncbi:MAG: hypothetical protein V3V97_22385 [Hyphomicrobiaceae bacterium]